jgi:hypothetical protein
MAGDNHRIRDIIINTGAIEPISLLLEQADPDSSFLRNVSWTLSNLCRGRPPPANHKIKRAIKALGKTLVYNRKEEILTDVCWALSYISDGGEENIEEMFNVQGLIVKIIELLSHDQVSITIPCLRIIGNIVTGDDKITQYVID